MNDKFPTCPKCKREKWNANRHRLESDKDRRCCGQDSTICKMIQIQNLRGSLNDCVIMLHHFMKDVGPCDHDNGVCSCQLRTTVEYAEELLK